MAFLTTVLGLFEAGMFPGCCYTLTTWYTPAQIHSRTTIYYSGASLAGAFSGLLAYGIGHLDGTWGFHGWRFIYVIEGLFTTVVAIAACFLLYDKPEKVGSWLTHEERRFLVLRSEYEYGQNSAGSNDDFSWKAARQSLKVRITPPPNTADPSLGTFTSSPSHSSRSVWQCTV